MEAKPSEFVADFDKLNGMETFAWSISTAAEANSQWYLNSTHVISMSAPLPRSRQVFRFFNNQTDFSLTREFITDLKSANSPFLILAVGNGRAGKSTRANQLMTHDLEPDGPFVADSGLAPITMGFQYCGPLKFGELGQIHDIDLDVNGDPDVFLIDCEGLNSLDDATPALKRATFALSQLASITLLVMKEQVNQQNIDHVRTLLLLSHAFSRALPGFQTGTTIMMREIGVPADRGRKSSLDQLNRKRQLADCDERAKIIDLLKDANFSCTDQTLLVLAQPQFHRQTDLYWKSIEDFLEFAAGIASLRANIAGSSLIDLFMEAKPFVMQVDDFANPSLPLDQLLETVTNKYLAAAHNHAIVTLRDEIRNRIDQISCVQLRKGLAVGFVTVQIDAGMQEFKQAAEKSLPRLLNYFPDKTRAFQQRVQDDVQAICHERFVSRCIDVLLPQLQNEILGQVKAEIQAEIKKLPLSDVGLFNFSKLLNRYETTIATRLTAIVSGIHAKITESRGFDLQITQLRSRISEYISDVETAQKVTHSKYLQAQSERVRKAQEEKFLKEVTRIGREEAEKQRKEDEARFEAFRKETEEKNRREIALQQDAAALKAQLEAQEQQHKALLESHERTQRDSEEMFKQLMAQQKARDEHARLQQEAEARANQARESELRTRISQLEERLSPPPTPDKCLLL
jgi:hypothetical protein